MRDELSERLLNLYHLKEPARLEQIGEFNLILHTAETQLGHNLRDLMLSEEDIKEHHIRRFDILTGNEIERTPAHAHIGVKVFRERIREVLKRLDPAHSRRQMISD